jgi:ATP-binding cassette subfamily B protein/subfamily B ATP-binding cassette protein MsbA
VWGIDESILTIMPLVVSTFSLAGMFFIMFSLNWKMAVVSLFVIPLFYGTYGVYSKRFATRVEEVQRMEGESMSIIQEVLGGLRIVKAFTREKHEHERFVSQGRSAAEARISLTNQQVIHSMVVGLITAGGTSLVLGIGAYQVLNGALTLGELLVILAYLASVYGPIEAVSTAMTYLHGYVAKMRRIFEIMEIEPDIRDAPRAKAFSCTRGNISFQSVRFSYANREHVLSDVSFSVDPGEVIGIVGPTGSGKTTLMSLIPRFYDPSAGRILIDDTDIRQLQVKSLREQVSIVPQEGILFWGTIRENIGYGKPGARLEEIMESARNAGAHEFITRLPDGYETHVGERGLTLSGGEKQRISIARAFLKNAPILILDEPTSALDARTESLLLDAIWRLTKGRTAFIVAHRLSTIRAADRILALERGRIVEQGTHSELLALDGLYASLYRQQTQFTGAHARGDH